MRTSQHHALDSVIFLPLRSQEILNAISSKADDCRSKVVSIPASLFIAGQCGAWASKASVNITFQAKCVGLCERKSDIFGVCAFFGIKKSKGLNLHSLKTMEI